MRLIYFPFLSSILAVYIFDSRLSTMWLEKNKKKKKENEEKRQNIDGTLIPEHSIPFHSIRFHSIPFSS